MKMKIKREIYIVIFEYVLPPDGANDDATFVVGIGVADTGVVEIGIEDMPATPDMDADTAGEAAGAGFATAVPVN
jgi:hypothetical protein